MTVITIPRDGGRLCARLRREVFHAAMLAGCGCLAYLGALALSQWLPWSTWWPVLTGAAVIVTVACRTPSGSTTVLTGARLAAGHPLHAAIAAAVVCLPWLGGWAAEAIRAGAEAAVRGLLATAAQAGGSASSGALDFVRGLIGGAR